MGGNVENSAIELALLWVLNLSDGSSSLLDIAERARLRFDLVSRAAALLEKSGLLRECD
jgi:aminopeptidase-like protein